MVRHNLLMGGEWWHVNAGFATLRVRGSLRLSSNDKPKNFW